MNVLLPTDFSENAEMACTYAFDIAKRTGGKVRILNAYDLPYSDRSLTTTLLEVMKENAEKNMNRFKNALADQGVPFDTEVRMGNPIRLIKDLAKADDIDLVVMGTKGASGLEEVLIGSNAASVIQNTDKPVLTIPPDTDHHALAKIVFATDFDVEKLSQPLQQLRAFAEVYQSTIDVVHVQNSGGSKKGSREVIEKALGNRLEEFTILQNENIEEAIRQEAEKEEAQVISTVAKKYSFFEGLFHSSLTSKLAYHSKIPLLALHEPN